MTCDLTHSLGLMREVVERLRQHDGIDEQDRETMIAILEEQIREMEREHAAGAWS